MLFGKEESRIRDLANQVAVARSEINFEKLITPINLEEEKARWTRGCYKDINPFFQYDEAAIKDSVNFLRAEILLPLGEIITSADRYGFLDNDGIFILDSLSRRYDELSNMRLFLEAIIDPSIMPINNSASPMVRLFGLVQTDELALAKNLAELSPEAAFFTSFEDTRLDIDIVDRSRRALFRQLDLYNLEGSVPPEQKKELEAKRLDSQTIAYVIKQTLKYMDKHAEYAPNTVFEQLAAPAFEVTVRPDITDICVLPFDGRGFGLIAVPEKCKMSGWELLIDIARKVDTEYRSQMSARAYFRDILDPYDTNNALSALVPLLSYSLNNSLVSGLATINTIKLEGAAGMPSPYYTLGIYHAQSGHSFAETMKFVRDFALIKMDEQKAAEVSWEVAASIFRGQTDTEASFGYIYPAEKVRIGGFLTVMNRIYKNSGRSYFEPFINLLRYASLSIEELNLLNREEKALGRILGCNPYRIWNYNNRGLSRIPAPIDFARKTILQ